MVMLQPVSGLYIVEEFVKSVGIEDGYDKFDKAVHERTGFHLSEQSPLKHVKSVTGPTLVAQVHDDTMTRPQDVQDIYHAIPVAETSLYWMEGTARRFDGYNFFGVIIRKPVFELVVKPDLGLFPQPKHAQLRGDRLQFLHVSSFRPQEHRPAWWSSRWWSLARRRSVANAKSLDR
jgi:hypothetical protein